jgi:hypothetical protein
MERRSTDGNSRSGRTPAGRPVRRMRPLHRIAVDGGMRQMRQERPSRNEVANALVRPEALRSSEAIERRGATDSVL